MQIFYYLYSGATEPKYSGSPAGLCQSEPNPGPIEEKWVLAGHSGAMTCIQDKDTTGKRGGDRIFITIDGINLYVAYASSASVSYSELYREAVSDRSEIISLHH